VASERGMLLALLEDERLDAKERTAFEDMSNFLQLKPRAALSKKQADWVSRRFEQLDLTAPAENLHSAGLVPEGRTHGVPPVVFPWQDGRMEKPLKPPRRPRKDEE